MTSKPLRESIREIDGHSWLLGDKYLLSRAEQSERTWAYKITTASLPLPKTRPLKENGEVELIHDVGGVSAVFAIGDSAFCKVKVLDVPNATREHTTLSWLQQRTWSFAIAETLFHAEFGGRYYIVLSRVPGDTIDKVWSNMTEHMRESAIQRIVEICGELKDSAQGKKVTGVDGNFLSEKYLCGRDIDCSPQNLLHNCQRLGMDCTRLVFYHCDLGPSNVLVDTEDGSIGIIDWETAGFVPVEWMRTKFRVSSGLDLSAGDKLEWRRRVMERMGLQGYPDVTEAFSAHRFS